MLCVGCGKNNPVEIISYPMQLCRICKLHISIDTYFHSTYAYMESLNYGKYILKSKNEISERNKALGFSFRQDKKHLQSIYLEIDEINFRNSYILLAHTLETVFNLICFEYAHIKSNYCDIPTLNLDKTRYAKQIFNIGKGDSGFLFEDSGFCHPSYWNLSRFVHLVCNILKHNDGDIKNHKAGEMLIQIYDLRENENIISYRRNTIYGIIPNVEIGDIISIASYLFIYCHDLVSILFNNPCLYNSNQIPFEAMDKIREFDLRENVSKLLMEELEKDCIMYFINK